MKEFSLKKSLAMLVVLFTLGACDLLETWADKVGGKTVSGLGYFSSEAEVFTSSSDGRIGKMLYFKLGDFTPDEATYTNTEEGRNIKINFWLSGDNIEYSISGHTEE